MRKNANIQSVEEAIKRLQEGEIFYYKSSTIYYSQKSILKGLSPFRIVGLFGNCSLSHSWTDYKDWEVEVEWQENIPEVGILCWVSDIDKNSKTELDVIKEYHHYKNDAFPFSGRWKWKYATPVQPEDYVRIFKECFI